MTDKKVPQAPEVERAILTLLMFGEKDRDYVFGEFFLKETYFYKPAYALIFAAIKEMYDKGMDIDQLSICERLRDQGNIDKVGGEVSVLTIAGEWVISASMRNYCGILRDKHIRRSMITIGTQLVNSSYDESEENILKIATGFSLQIDGVVEQKETAKKLIVDSLIDANASIAARANSMTGLTGVPTGFPKFDYNTGGFQKGDLIIIAARPGVGKTSLALNFITHAISRDHPVGMLSLEMTSTKLAERMIAEGAKLAISEVHYNKPSQVKWKEVSAFCSKAGKYPFYIDDTCGLNIADMTSKARQMHREYGIEMLVIDYLQLGRGMGEQSRRLEIEGLTSGLKAIAKNLDIAVVCLSQLRRLGAEEKSRQPGLSDLKESGSIESDSNIVMFIYEPTEENKGKYFTAEGRPVPSEEITSKMRRLDIAKNRQGPLFSQMLHFEGKFFRFGEMGW